MTDPAYPITDRAQAGSPQLSVVAAVARALALQGYPEVKNGADALRLDRALHEFLYGLPGATRVFSFGYGQTCPVTGKSLVDHHAVITAPTAEQCHDWINEVFGGKWSAEYASLAEATSNGQFPSSEHIRIVIGGA